LPHEAAAYRVRGDAQLERRDWARCAADFAAAEAYTGRDDPAARTAELRRKLGICQARAGALSEAEKTLAETAASGTGSGDVWTRLGEVRIAMGKLDEAIAALQAAIEHTDPATQAIIRFTLAAAFDRARRPADALFEAGEGVKLDRQLAVLQNPTLPPVAPGDLEYMLGLAYSSNELSRPEYALAYFRKFVRVAPESQWRRRADDHIRELRTSELPDTIVGTGTSPLAVDAARAATRRVMPQMRACLANLPATVVEVEVSRAGPRTPPTDRVRPRFFTPPDGVTVRRSIGEISDAELASVDRCLQPFATHLQLPAIKERDTYYKAMFYVVGP
jgi:tetratricopeptide (TPR) repeat protein